MRTLLMLLPFIFFPQICEFLASFIGLPKAKEAGHVEPETILTDSKTLLSRYDRQGHTERDGGGRRRQDRRTHSVERG